MIDLIYLAKDRLEFTKASLQNLLLNTNWSKVGRLIVYDDNSTDGTREYLRSLNYVHEPGWRFGEFGSPVAIMNDYIRRGPAEMFAKIDSDTMVPFGWLDECLKVMESNHKLDLLGIEAFRPVQAGVVERSYDDAVFIGGIGVMRSRHFLRALQGDYLPRPNGRFGFTAWQEQHEEVVKGWLNPALPVFLLDWLPREPWRSLTKEYIAKGWNRDWNALFPAQCPYPEERKDLWSWWCE